MFEYRSLVKMLAVIVATTNSAIAADISVSETDGPSGAKQSIVRIVGDMHVDDILRFKQISKSLPPQTIVSLESPGGSLLAGIEIGKVIAASSFATSVQGVCASSCALVWLAGAPRILAPSAKVGFHLAYKSDMDKTESGAGNALVGSYVTGLGFGDNVVRYITSAAPGDMQWLSSRDSDLLGIDIVVSEDRQTRSVTRETSPADTETVDPTVAAVELITSIIIATTYSDAKALETVRQLYADRVLYFGEMKSRVEVYTDKLKYIKRWPYRSVNLREDSISASCQISRCKVTGIYDWGVGNAKGRKKNGTAVFVYEFEVSDKIHITTEGGEVLSRY
ncbi:hypothetical protein [Hoeflea sp. IMCC20628]|uniref:hypothetical protein n=1 Tax=Hoeflea sp. IMCC20628 TaxID=1620421 RepID=UPI0012E0361D|nr:hypothetical protein [Hoeflea sp. IMCC20628]